MGEPSQKYWFSDMEIHDCDLFNHRDKIASLHDEDQIFQEIMHHQLAFSSVNETHSLNDQNKSIQAGNDTNNNNNNDNICATLQDKSNNSNFIFSQHAQEKPATATTAITFPSKFILSFDNSTVVGDLHQTYGGKQPYHEQEVGNDGTCLLSKGVLEKHDTEPKSKPATRRGRSSAETLEHIMTERKRRRKLTERFIELSATIPGLKKIDKGTILSEAITYVKRLKERVRELEEQCKKTKVESVSFVNQRSHIPPDKSTTSGAMNSDNCYKTSEELPTVEARVYKKDILLHIHSKMQSGIVIKILDHLNSLDLSTISNSVTPFGSSTLDISIVAQMGDKFNVTINDLVKNLRMTL